MTYDYDDDVDVDTVHVPTDLELIEEEEDLEVKRINDRIYLATLEEEFQHKWSFSN